MGVVSGWPDPLPVFDLSGSDVVLERFLARKGMPDLEGSEGVQDRPEDEQRKAGDERWLSAE